MNVSSYNLSTLTIRVFLPLAFCYVLSYLSRAAPAVLNEEISTELLLSASQLGFYASVFFLCMALWQIPIGIALDLVGPRKTIAFLTMIASFGSFLTFFSQDFTTLVVARALIGTGMAGTMMGTLKAIKDWFPHDKVFMYSGFTGAAGSLGALLATLPLELASQAFGWRNVFIGIGLVMLGAGVAIFLSVPARSSQMRRHEPFGVLVRQQWQQYTFVLRLRLLHILILPCSLIVGTTMGTQTLWAGPWMRRVEMRSEAETATVLLAFTIMQLLSQTSMGLLKRVGQRFGVTTLDLQFGFMLLVLFSYGFVFLLGSAWATPFWLSLGISMVLGTISFGVLGEFVPKRYSGRALTTLNCCIFFAVFSIQWLMGIIANFYPRDALGLYPGEAYRASFIFGLLMLLIGVAWYSRYLWRYGRQGLLHYINQQQSA